MQQEEKAKKLYVEAVEEAKAELDKNPSIQGKKAFDELRTEHFNFLNKLKQTAFAQEKGRFVNYLFEKALSRLSSLKVSNKPSLFLVYAHENKAHGKAEAGTSKYLIEKLSQIQVILYSDQTPIGKPYSSPLGELKKDSKLEDILTNQLCLLPGQLRSDVKPVDKVVVCCSEVLGSYLKWPEYDSFYQKLREAYGKDREAYLKGDEQGNAWAIREVVREFSQEEKYKARFHHVLTEMAFLQIRAEQSKDGHGIIPVPLTRNSYDTCLSSFVSSTAVRMGDVPRFEEQAQAGQEVYPNQSRHWVLFKLIERLLVGSDEAKTFLGKFWRGYSDCISRLKNEPTLGVLEFNKLVDGMFDEIERSLHKQLASAVQQVYPAWQQVDTRLLEQSRDLAQIQTGIDSLVARLLGNLWENIQKLRLNYLEDLEKDREIKDALANYVSPEGMLMHDSERFLLEGRVQEFLNLDKRTLLLLGEAGSGKSTFNRHLAVSLWEAYSQKNNTEDVPIPVFIGLSSLSSPDRNLVSAFFEKQGFSREQIKELQSRHRFVLILDGFDEIEHRQQEFYKDNELSHWKDAKIIISSRPEYLGPNYQYKFHPPGEHKALQEYRLAPFSVETIKRYIDRYSEKHPHALWSAEKYKKELEESSLKELVGNPFLLKITLSVLPELSEELEAKGQRFTRIRIYDQFVKSWFDRSQRRLNQILEVGSKERKEFKDLERADFSGFGMDFSQELALEMYQVGEVMTHYQAITYAKWKRHNSATEGDWRRRLLGDEDASTVLMRLNAPLICQDRPNDLGKEYRFIHKSLRDYFVARALWEELRGGTKSNDVELSKKLNAIRNIRPVWEGLEDGFEFDQSAQFNELNVVEDPAVQSFLVERVQEDRVLLKALLAWVKASKTREDVKRGASNALTVLVKAGVQFIGCDLRGIKVPGADLSFGVFDSAQLQGSDLTGVKLGKSWLRDANLSAAQMAGVQFGELPYLQEESSVNSCAYSPDGENCAVGLENGKISVYSTSNWRKIHILEGHTWVVKSVVYSPRGGQLASGSSDNTVRLWDVESGAPLQKLEGHTAGIFSVVYSPRGDQLASGSSDNTVRLWDAESGAPLQKLEGHTGGVFSVVYSPRGDQLASGSSDNTVRLWDAESGVLMQKLEGHTDEVLSVMYSPRGDQLASGSWDNTVRLWDIESGAPLHKLEGHTAGVFSVVYSPRGDQLASGSSDNTVRLWDVENGASKHKLEGHTGGVYSVVYSSRGDQLASGSLDNTVRLWDVESGAPLQKLERHTDRVLSVVYSPRGDQLASGSLDNTVRLWDVESGAPLHKLEGHTGGVFSVVYSPRGEQLASGSLDNTVRLWDVESGVPLHKLEGHTAGVFSVVYSPRGDQLASGSLDNTVRLWDVESGASLQKLEGHTAGVLSVVYSPRGDQLASGSFDNTVRLWNVESGAPLQKLEGHTAIVWSVVYSPQGDQLASGSFDNTVRLWDVESGAPLQKLEGHTAIVWSVVYSPQGDQLASGSFDNTVRLWQPQTGECQMLIEDSGPVRSLAWKETSDGHDYLGIGSMDKSVRQWELKKEGGEYKAYLKWGTGHGFLTVRGALIERVEGLSEMNGRLLKQRGALERRVV